MIDNWALLVIGSVDVWAELYTATAQTVVLDNDVTGEIMASFLYSGRKWSQFLSTWILHKKAYTLRVPLSACALDVITQKHFTSSHCSTPSVLYYQKRHLEKQASHTGLVNWAIWRNNISELKIWSSKLGPFMGDWWGSKLWYAY